jgi:PKD repeat protein
MFVKNGRETGAAEMIGALMLITLFMAAAAILALTYFSTPPPDRIPAVNIIATNQTRLINLYHAGGDALSQDRLQILVDGTARPFTGFGNDNNWSLGETLSYTVSASDPLPSRVDVVYNQTAQVGTGSYLLATLWLGSETSQAPEALLHTITATAGSHGTIILDGTSQTGTVVVANGTTPTFDITPAGGYIVLNVLVDGSDVGPVASYTFPPVTADHTIAATFAQIPGYWINVTNSTGGYITPGNLTVIQGGFQNYTITPYTGYTIASVSVNGAQLGSVPSFYNFTNVNSNQNLSVTFSSIYLPGIVGTYYKDRQWSLPGTTLIHPRIQFANGQANMSTGNGGSSAPTDIANWPFGYTGETSNFSVNYSGLLHIEVTDTYQFSVTGCDGYYLNINNVPLSYLGSPGAGTTAFTTPTQHASPGVILNPGYYNFSALMWDSNTNGNTEQGAIAVYYTNTSKTTPTLITNFNHTPFVIPAAGFTATPLAGTAPLTVNFTDTSVGATAWQWDFGDGSNVSNAQNPTHTYTLGGSYMVNQTVSNTYGSDIESKPNYVTVGAAYSSGLLGTYFNNMTWSAPGVTRIDPRIRFSNSWGGYVYETDQPNWPNSTLSSNAYTGNDNDPLALFSVIWDGYLRVTTPDTYTFNLTADDGAYLFIDGNSVINNGGIHAPFTQYGTAYLTPGYHHIVVNYYEQYERATAYLQWHNSTSSTFQYVTDVWHINPPPTASFTGTPTSGNAPLSVAFTDSSANHPDSWSWNFGDTGTSALQNPVHLYTANGTYTVSLTVTNISGGVNTLTRSNYITVSPALSVVNFIGTPTNGTAPLAVSFSDQSSNSPTGWNWSFGDGSYSTSQNPSYSYPALGNYTVTLNVTNAGGSNSTTRSGYISVNPLITASATSGGTISPAGSTQVTYGTNQSYTITNSTGYYLASVLVDGVSAGITSNQTTTYTFTNVTASHTIAATYASNPVITSSAGAGGSISPLGALSVTYGSSQTYTITNSTGNYLASVSVDGVSAGITSNTTITYTFTNVTASHTIAATFASNPVITSSAGAGGSISPLGALSVTYGSSQTYTITDSPGYSIQNVMVNNTYSQGAITSYTFRNVTQTTQTIAATFVPNPVGQIYYENFDSGGWPYAGWTRASNNVVQSATIRNGTSGNSIRIRNKDYMFRTIPTSGYMTIVVQFAWAGNPISNGNYAQAQYTTDGTTWTSFQQLSGPLTQANLNIVTYSTLPTTVENNPNFGLRWQMYGTANTEYLYVDDVKVTGVPI